MVINCYFKLYKTLLCRRSTIENSHEKNYFIAETWSFLGFTGVVS
jgi:hypothetical protein